MARPQNLRVYDALYGDVILDETITDLAWRPLVQRLRQVRLSNIDSLDMPGIANVSRYEHSLGVAYLASRVGFSLQLSKHDRIALQAAALVHDTAITPFGHLAEEAAKYVGSDFDHELKWSVLVAREDPRELGGLDRQIFLGRMSGLREWAGKTFGGCGPSVLEKIISAIQGDGMLGPCISGKIDLDNLDNVVRIAHHMGLRPDTGLPIRIAEAMSEINDSGEIIFRHGALPDIGLWIQTREEVYQRLMPSPMDFCGKLMLTYATVSALEAKILQPTDWHLTDMEYIGRLLGANKQEVRETTTRWLLGDIWDLADLIWMRGPLPPFRAMGEFAAEVSDRLCRPCFAYRIKDKRKRRVAAFIESGDQIVVGENSDRWLLGVGSPKRAPFTTDDTRHIVSLAIEAFQAERVHATSAEGALF